MIPKRVIRSSRYLRARHFSNYLVIGDVHNATRSPERSCQWKSDMGISVVDLVDRFRLVYEERMRDLPIVNPRLEVEAVGFDQWEDQDLGVLITPWFMNLVLLPDTDELGDRLQGDLIACEFPSGTCELTICHDEQLGTYLAAVLFRTVVDFPDQETARAIAEDALANILVEPDLEAGDISRRDLLRGLQGS